MMTRDSGYEDLVARQQMAEKYENRWIYLYSIFCVVILLFSSVVALSTLTELQHIDDELRADVDAFKYLTDSAWLELNRLDVVDAVSHRPKRSISASATFNDNHQTVEQECPNGPPGPKGANGEPGEPGADGVDGNIGLPGGNYVYESLKTPCIWCPMGLPGARGPPGQPGPSGQPGADGKPGYNGADGQQGPKGPAGDPGSVGAPGEPGQGGMPGASASRVVGNAGTPGRPGIAGPPGPPGDDGADGPPGQVGPVGKAGDNGLPGNDGILGAPGKNGSPGKDSKDVGYCDCPARSAPTRPILSNHVDRPAKLSNNVANTVIASTSTPVKVFPAFIAIEVRKKVH